MQKLQIFQKPYFVLRKKKRKERGKSLPALLLSEIGLSRNNIKKCSKIIGHVNWAVATGSNKAIQLDSIITSAVSYTKMSILVFSAFWISPLSTGLAGSLCEIDGFSSLKNYLNVNVFGVFFCSQPYLPPRQSSSHKQFALGDVTLVPVITCCICSMTLQYNCNAAALPSDFPPTLSMSTYSTLDMYSTLKAWY